MRSSPDHVFHYAEVLVAPTWNCNLRCKYCFVDKTGVSDDTPAMTYETGARVIDALDEGLANVKHICVHLYGGEPFTNLPAIEGMVDRVQEKTPGRFSFIATTNGTVLSDKVIDIIGKSNMTIQLSLDGPQDIHDGCRVQANGSPTHQTVIRFLETVRDKTSVHIIAAAVIRSGSRLLDITDYLRTLPIDNIKAQAVRLPDDSPYALTKAEWELYKQDLMTIAHKVIAEIEAGKSRVDDRFNNRLMQMLSNADRQKFCDAGQTNFGITPNGDIKACILLTGPKDYLGHIDDPDPKVWRQKGMDWRAAPLEARCKDCSYLNLCGGGCPATLSVCGTGECSVVAMECDATKMIFDHFKDHQEALLVLVGIT
jgi:uncharacterized protein